MLGEECGALFITSDDGVVAFQNKGLVFRTTDRFGIDRLCLYTFFSGDEITWAPKKKEKLFIKNLTISQ